MASLRSVHEWDDHFPDYGTLVFREWSGDPGDRPPPAGLLPPDEYDEVEDTVNAELALTGVGWFHGNLRQGEEQPAIRVELWDGPPPPAAEAEWAAADLVADLPYWSPTGTLRSDGLVPSSGGREIPLAGPGGYQVRTWCRPAAPTAAESWRLQFWPTGDAPPRPARWLRRDWTHPVVPETGWFRYLGFAAQDLVMAVQAATAGGPGATVADLEAWFEPWHPDGHLDQPIFTGPPVPPPTGDPRLDATRAADHAETTARYAAQRDRVARFAAELGVPAPVDGRTLLDFLVATGQLRRADDAGVPRYRPEPHPPRADRMVALPPDEVAAIERAAAEATHGYLARDVRAVVVWAPHRLLATTLTGLADRLRSGPAAVRAALAYLVELDRLAVHGDPADPDAPLTIAAELPDRHHGDPHRRSIEESLLRAAGHPVPADPADPAPHLRPRPRRPAPAVPAPAPRPG